MRKKNLLLACFMMVMFQANAVPLGEFIRRLFGGCYGGKWVLSTDNPTNPDGTCNFVLTGRQSWYGDCVDQTYKGDCNLELGGPGMPHVKESPDAPMPYNVVEERMVRAGFDIGAPWWQAYKQRHPNGFEPEEDPCPLPEPTLTITEPFDMTGIVPCAGKTSTNAFSPDFVDFNKQLYISYHHQSGTFLIRHENTISDIASVQVFGMDGKEYPVQLSGRAKNSVNLQVQHNLFPGVYILRLRVEGVLINRKVFVQ